MSSRTNRFVEGIREFFATSDDYRADRIIAVIDGNLDADAIPSGTWIGLCHYYDEEVALRFAGTGGEAYYCYVEDGTTYVERQRQPRKSFDPEGDYVESLFEAYDVQPVLLDDIERVGGSE